MYEIKKKELEDELEKLIEKRRKCKRETKEYNMLTDDIAITKYNLALTKFNMGYVFRD